MGFSTFTLFVNSVYCNIKYSFFTCKVCCLIIIWECNCNFYFISRMRTDQLIFKVINIASGSDNKICTTSISTSTIECLTINLTYIININSISILYFKGRICIKFFCGLCCFRCCCSFCSFSYFRCRCHD